MATTLQFRATGLTCGHCASAVREEVGALPGVGDVEVEVISGGESTVTVSTTRDLTPDEVAAALDEAGGYALVR